MLETEAWRCRRWPTKRILVLQLKHTSSAAERAHAAMKLKGARSSRPQDKDGARKSLAKPGHRIKRWSGLWQGVVDIETIDKIIDASSLGLAAPSMDGYSQLTEMICYSLYRCPSHHCFIVSCTPHTGEHGAARGGAPGDVPQDCQLQE